MSLCSILLTPVGKKFTDVKNYMVYDELAKKHSYPLGPAASVEKLRTTNHDTRRSEKRERKQTLTCGVLSQSHSAIGKTKSRSTQSCRVRLKQFPPISLSRRAGFRSSNFRAFVVSGGSSPMITSWLWEQHEYRCVCAGQQ
jgi:hypothetical protein